MIRIIDERDSGKTRKLLTECGKQDGLFVCRHPERVVDKCAAYGIPLVEAIGYQEFYENMRNKNSRKIFIDELEIFVNEIVPYLSGYTLTKEN